MHNGLRAMLTTQAIKNWLDRLPKVELHIHIEVAIPLPALWQLIEKYGAAPNIGGIDALRDRFRYLDFQQFSGNSRSAWIDKAERETSLTGFTERLVSPPGQNTGDLRGHKARKRR